jgi:hypothetical protein
LEEDSQTRPKTGSRKPKTLGHDQLILGPAYRLIGFAGVKRSFCNLIALDGTAFPHSGSNGWTGSVCGEPNPRRSNRSIRRPGRMMGRPERVEWLGTVQTARVQNIAEYVGGHFGRTARTRWPPSWLSLVALQVFGGVRHVHPCLDPMISSIVGPFFDLS